MDRTQLRSAVLMCHAPIVIPAVGGTEAPRCRATTEAMGEAAGLLAACGAARVVVDPVSLEYLQGSELDWVDALIGASFQIRNPNAKSSCGCGTSFAL